MAEHQKSVEHRRQLMDRHARVAVLVDRLRAHWTVCAFERDDGVYEPVDKEWSEELVTELEWLNNLYAEALANEGDVRAVLSALPSTPRPDAPKARAADVQ